MRYDIGEWESGVEGHLCVGVEKRGGMCEKFIPDYRNGMPDRIVLLPGGITLWVETKKPKGGKLSALQEFRHEQLRSRGHRVYIAWSREQVDAFLQMVDAELENITDKEKSLGD